MEAPPGYRSQPPGGTEGQGMKDIPRLLAAHLQETERRRRTLSPREALNARKSLVYEDTTRVWWNSLPKGVVENYEDLKRRFRSRFKQHKKQTKTHLAINGIKRKEGESVRAFITRYTDETAQITRLNEDQRIAGFIHGVKIKSLVKFVSTELPESYDGLIEKVYSLLQAEETASEGKSITFMDRNAGEKPLKGRP
ncbi:reverse transcriptase domain-containing protein [Tanacetum coccineum]|uniref:Reverse transcriptase domain-containing protein n=1 Tax=Tanacetum coccineum TaxID=301880 RepID=A0ABQ5IBW8_9ASTR